MANIGGVAQNMRCAITANVGSNRRATFMFRLDGEEPSFRKIIWLIDIDHLVMNAAQKHQIAWVIA